jgi:hypothetical protein
VANQRHRAAIADETEILEQQVPVMPPNRPELWIGIQACRLTS